MPGRLQSDGPRKCLVTGGMGFIGSTLVCRLVESGYVVTVMDNLLPNYGGNRFNIDGFHDRVRVVVGDVRDRELVIRTVEGMDCLFNLAGQTSHMDSMEDPFTDLDINCKAQLSILEACRRVNPGIKVVFASTRQIYGRPERLPVDEKHLLQPVDVNGINKMAGEWYHILYNNVYGIRTCALRLTNTYGPRMRVKDARQTFLGIWIRDIVQGRPFEVWGGDQLRDFTYVDDVVDALIQVATNDAANGQVFNLGGERAVSLKELANLLVEVASMGSYFIRPFPEKRKGIDIGDYYADWTKIRDLLGWGPRVSLRDGLARTVEFYRKNIEQYK